MIFIITNILIIFYYGYLQDKKLSHHNHFQPNIFINKQEVGKIFFGLMTLRSSSQRRKEMYDIWLKHIAFYGHEYGFVSNEPIESIYKWIPSKDWSSNELEITEDRDRKNKRVSGAEYFLKNTTADFYISSTDDIIVDYKRINDLGIILKKKYDTNKDSIMLGNCQTYSKNVTYLQGGSGYIMSRKMASDFVKYSKRWLDEPKRFDDLDIAKFLSYVGKKPSDGTVPYMIGHMIIEVFANNFDPHKLQKCPRNIYDPFCKQGIHKLSDVYIIHVNNNQVTGSDALHLYNEYTKMIYDEKHQYGFYDTYPLAHVCILK